MTANTTRSNRIRPRLPRGFADRSPGDIRAVDAMLATIKGVYERYGFDPVETPFLEYTDALGKFLPDSDRPNEGVFSLKDDDDQWLSLRYDLTAPLARYVAENFETLPKPYRSYRTGWVFRNEKPGPGRFRQFLQMDADTVGSGSVAADAEMAMMMADVMEAVGIGRGDYVIRVNNRKVLDGVMETVGVADEGQILAVLRALDKYDRLGISGVRQLLGAGRKDKSGDFTPGAGLSPSQIDAVATYLEAADLADARRGLVADDQASGSPDSGPTDPGPTDPPTSQVLTQGLDELADIERLVEIAGYADRVKIDQSVVRGLEYYTGPVFEADLTFKTVNEKGREVIFGSVGGGGRYDGLIGRFRGEDVPATGFSIGVSRLAAALGNLGKLADRDATGPVIVTIMDRDRLADYQAIAAELRGAGVRAELYLGNPRQFGKQLQYADRRNSPCAVIQGSDEADRGVVQIKDLVEGKKKAAAIANNEAWREERPGQYEVPASNVVAEIQALLARQKSP